VVLFQRGEREHAPELFQTANAPFHESGEKDFGVSTGVEDMTAALQFRPQLEEIVDFPVQRDDQAAITRPHWLVTGGAQVEDGEPPVAHQQSGSLVEAEVVRASVAEPIHGRSQFALVVPGILVGAVS
jgi:hypothetical protein